MKLPAKSKHDANGSLSYLKSFVCVFMSAVWCKILSRIMDANRWGTRGTCPPHFFRLGDIIRYVPPTFFSLGFAFGEVAKIKVTFVTFHVRCIAKPSWCWNRVSCGITDFDIFIGFRFDKIIFSILQVSTGRGRLLTASVRHFTVWHHQWFL